MLRTVTCGFGAWPASRVHSACAIVTTSRWTISSHKHWELVRLVPQAFCPCLRWIWFLALPGLQWLLLATRLLSRADPHAPVVQVVFLWADVADGTQSLCSSRCVEKASFSSIRLYLDVRVPALYCVATLRLSAIHSFTICDSTVLMPASGISSVSCHNCLSFSNPICHYAFGVDRLGCAVCVPHVALLFGVIAATSFGPGGRPFQPCGIPGAPILFTHAGDASLARRMQRPTQSCYMRLCLHQLLHCPARSAL